MIKKIFNAFETLLFPTVCLVCDSRLYDKEQYVCEYCLKRRFPDPNPHKNKSCEGILLPDQVYFQEAMWKFDQGSSLQKLLHHLKYHGLGALGIEMGIQLGNHMKNNPGYALWEEKAEEIIVVGVPLHSKKLRIRGYNQAEKIAIGVGRALNLSVFDESLLTRVRFTKTQTRFSHLQRIENMNEAFLVVEPELLTNRCVLLVDDVFTTGSTTFACASALQKGGAKQIGIITLAVA
ncbi:ComF family protein [bacterium]|nr:MAG: ComF family protein [bacterium]